MSAGRRIIRVLNSPYRLLRLIMTQPKKSVPVALSAALVVFSFPRFDIYPLIFFCLVPLLTVVTRVTPGKAFGWGLLCGMLITGVGFYFMIELLIVFGALSVPFALVLHLLFAAYQGVNIALFAMLTSYLSRSRRLPLALIVPASLVFAEFVCREFFIFPWVMGNATYQFTAFIQVAEFFGGFGLTALIALVNVAIFQVGEAIWARRKGDTAPERRIIPWRSVAVAAVLFGSTVVYGFVRIPAVDELVAEQPTIRIGLVEANIGIMAKANAEDVADNMLIHQNMSAQLEADGADLIVWPETAANPIDYVLSVEPADDFETLAQTTRLYPRVPRDVTFFLPSWAPLVDHAQDDVAQETPRGDTSSIQRGFHTALLFGVLTVGPLTEQERAGQPPHPRYAPLKYYNSAILLDAEGRVLGRGDKNVLLVFGEYVPLSHFLYRTFGFNFYDFIPTAGNVTAGDHVTAMDLPLERDGETLTVRIGVMICYEDIIAEYGLALSELQPNLFINLINDAWFLETSAAYHHMAFSVLRTVEHRLPLVRSTNTGVSSFIDPVGRIVSHTELTGRETLMEDVAIMPPPTTLYSKVGDIIGWAAVGAVAVMVVKRRKEKRQKPTRRRRR